MAMSTTTIRQTTTMCDAFVEESDNPLNPPLIRGNGIFSFRSLYDAYIMCRRRKRNTINALRFDVELLENLYSLKCSLNNGTYNPSRSVCFVTHKPKLREIFAADFKDRVVHHLLVPLLEKIFEPKFIYDSYACRKNKGTHGAVKRLRYFMNKITHGGRVPAWFIQLDIKSFFMGIDKEILTGIVERHIKDENLPLIMDLTRKIINNDCTENFIYKGNPKLLDRIPPHKSLFHTPKNKGLPIGNLTSQFFANVYLNELDQYIKHTLKARYYLRYVDDLILLDSSKERLLEMKKHIEDFLQRRLTLSLKKEFKLRRVSEGADFLGYIVRHDYVLVRNRVIGNLSDKLNHFRNRIVVEGAIGKNKYTIVHMREDTIQELRQTLASYLGHFKHANAHNLTKSLFEKYPYLKYIFTPLESPACNGGDEIEFLLERTRGLMPNGEDFLTGFTLSESDKLVPLYEPPFCPPNLKVQYLWFTERYREYCIFFHVGRFCEFYGDCAEKFASLFGIKMAKETRGMGRQCGFPIRMLKDFKKKALLEGQAYIVVAERGYYPTGLKRRVVTEILKFKKGREYENQDIYFTDTDTDTFK